jgi:hypothetical protein
MKRFALAILVALVATPAASPRAHAFRGLNGAIAYVKDQELWLVGPGERGPRGVTSGRFDSDPAWSPDGSTLAFTRLGLGGLDIYTYTPAEDAVVPLTNDPAPEYDPAWSPDGRRLVFVRADELWTMAADGSDAGRIRVSSPRPDRFGAFDPAWSPDGARIVFGTNVSDASSLYVQAFTISPDGSGERQLTTTPGNKFAFAWSPDGSKLAYVSDRNGAYEVYAADSGGGGERQLTSESRTHCPPYPCTVPAFNPAWSPDGTRIAFAHDHEGTPRLYTMSAEGGSPAAVTDLSGMPGLAGNADWQPAVDLSVAPVGRPKPARVGRFVTVVFRVRNPGPLDTRDVEVGLAITGGARATAKLASGRCAGLSCELAALTAGRTALLNVRIRPARPGRIRVSARATAATGEANDANNGAAVQLTARR